MKKFLKDKKGATGIEYALIASLVSVVIIVGVSFVGEGVKKNMDFAADQISRGFEPAAGGVVKEK